MFNDVNDVNDVSDVICGIPSRLGARAHARLAAQRIGARASWSGSGPDHYPMVRTTTFGAFHFVSERILRTTRG